MIRSAEPIAHWKSGQKAQPGQPPKRLVLDGPVVVGRATDCQLWLDDRRMSRRHCRLERVDGRWFVEDLGSTNGTFVGDQRVEAPTQLATGTPVRVGQSVIELQR